MALPRTPCLPSGLVVLAEIRTTAVRVLASPRSGIQCMRSVACQDVGSQVSDSPPLVVQSSPERQASSANTGMWNSRILFAQGSEEADSQNTYVTTDWTSARHR